jgi:hypothetical protein
MAHFAELDETNVVLRVVVINNDDIGNLSFPESEPAGIAFCKSLFGADTAWKQSSYNSSFRFNSAGIGYSYDPSRDAFIPPRPDGEGWFLDEGTCNWINPDLEALKKDEIIMGVTRV